MRLKKNLGRTDQIVRGVISALLLVYAYWNMSWIALIFGVFVMVESLTSWCVLYQILGKSSCPVHKKKK